jgi:hypothetical protein
MAGCQLGERRLPAAPQRHAFVRDQLVFHSQQLLPQDHRLLDELAAQRDDLLEQLALPASDEPIHIYLFDTPESFQAFMRGSFRNLPDRRAFFVQGDTTLSVYAHWGDRVAEDLRHEVAHGYLHSVMPHIPLWLDEGLAEYFEVPRQAQGLNAPHVELLGRQLACGWKPQMQRLEGLQSPGDMSQLDYAESWAWVHFLLRTTPERRELLRGHLRELRSRGTAPPLSAQIALLWPGCEQALVDHVKGLLVAR